jgi:hypothetical protein
VAPVGATSVPSMIILRRRWLPLLLSLVALSAAACSSGSPGLAVKVRPTTSLTPSAATAFATATPTPSPTSTAAVEAGVRGWIAAANKAFATGDTKDLREHTARGCGCSRLVRTVEGYWSHGSIRGLVWTLDQVDVIDIHHGVAAVQFTFDGTLYRVVTSGRTAVNKAKRITVFSQFAMEGGMWRLADYLQDKVELR